MDLRIDKVFVVISSHHVCVFCFLRCFIISANFSAPSLPFSSFDSTYAWTAPELFLNSNAFSLATDVYALGVLFYEIATGLTPWSGENDVKKKVMKGERPPIPPFVPAAVAQLIEECWAQQVKYRPAAHIIVTKLQRIASQLESSPVSIVNQSNKQLVQSNATASVSSHSDDDSFISTNIGTDFEDDSDEPHRFVSRAKKIKRSDRHPDTPSQLRNVLHISRKGLTYVRPLGNGGFGGQMTHATRNDEERLRVTKHAYGHSMTHGEGEKY